MPATTVKGRLRVNSGSKIEKTNFSQKITIVTSIKSCLLSTIWHSQVVVPINPNLFENSNIFSSLKEIENSDENGENCSSGRVLKVKELQ